MISDDFITHNQIESKMINNGADMLCTSGDIIVDLLSVSGAVGTMCLH